MSPFRLAVINPGGADPDQDFSSGPSDPGAPGHPPINYHAYAACTGGVFLRDESRVPENASASLVVLRPKHLSRALKAILALKERGARVFVTLKESGLAQVCGALSDRKRWDIFRAIAKGADGFVSSTADLVPLYNGAGFRVGGFAPTPYPLEFSSWDFSIPAGERRGVFVGTREFGVPSRSHLAALAAIVPMAAEGVKVTVIVSGRADAFLASQVCPGIHALAGPLPYADYLRLMASHAFVWQADRSSVPGQVAGDALLCGIPCLGGDGSIDRLAFGGPGSLDEALRVAKSYLSDPALCASAGDDARHRAREILSFAAGNHRLREICS